MTTTAVEVIAVILINIILWFYALFNIILTWKLSVNLWSDKHNYLPKISPSKQVKISAIALPAVFAIIMLISLSMGIVVGVHYDNFRGIGMYQLSLHQDNNILQISSILVIIVYIMFSIAWILFPIHLFLRIRNFYNQNVKMGAIFKYRYCIIYILIIIEYLSIIFFGIFSTEKYTKAI